VASSNQSNKKKRRRKEGKDTSKVQSTTKDSQVLSEMSRVEYFVSHKRSNENLRVKKIVI
jgi:hypothetical protein